MLLGGVDLPDQPGGEEVGETDGPEDELGIEKLGLESQLLHPDLRHLDLLHHQ